MTKNLLLTLSMVIGFLSANGQDSSWQRTYELNAFNQRDLRMPSDLGYTVNMVLSDAFKKNIKSRMGETTGNISYGIFSFATTYMTMIWSHELGHALRAKQVGGEFRIHNGALPIPYTTMHLPKDINLHDEALSVTGGFEVNYLTARKIQRRYIEQNGIYNEDYSYAFANTLMFPIYTSLIVPMNPEDRNRWINTAGDPVHCILPVFKAYSDGKVFMSDSSVNPELVQFYNQAVIFGNFFRLLDPHFYREIGGAFGKASKLRRPVFIIGDHHTGWTYGTMFNVSPLGYELYLNNYLHLGGNQFSFYVKTGNPFKNNGMGLRWANLYEGEFLHLGLSAEAWDQDIYGSGWSSEIESTLNFSDQFGVNLFMGFKTRGYTLGKQIDQGANIGFGFAYHPLSLN